MGCTTEGSSDSRSNKECDDGYMGYTTFQEKRHLADKREGDLPQAWPEPRIQLSRGRNENKKVSGLHQPVSTTYLLT